jgi:hypothetical protein
MSAIFALVLLLQTADPNWFNQYLIMGYVVMGSIVLFYIISLAIRQRNVEQDLKLLQQLLQENEEDPE